MNTTHIYISFHYWEEEVRDFLNETIENDIIDTMFPDTIHHWTLYVDPVTSLMLTVLILYTTLGLLKVNGATLYDEIRT